MAIQPVQSTSSRPRAATYQLCLDDVILYRNIKYEVVEEIPSMGCSTKYVIANAADYSEERTQLK
jgi:hypothetical protein